MAPIILASLAALALNLSATAPGPPLAAIRAEELRAMAALNKPLTLAERFVDRRTDAERFKASDARQARRFAGALSIAEANPGTRVGAEAVGWAISIPRSYYQPRAGGLFRYALRYLADQPEAAGAIVYLRSHCQPQYNPGHKAAFAFVDAVAGRHPDRAVKGYARYVVACRAFDAYQVAEYDRKPDAEALARVTEAELDAIVRDFGSEIVPGAKRRTLTDEVRTDLHELRSLRPGKPLPGLTGVTLTGEPFDPGVTRGKVTLVVFWAEWCGPCMEMVPQELKLAKHYAGRPFALVGVNGDETREHGLRTARAEGMTWPSIWEDHDGERTLSRAFSVRGWPTIYLADAKGTIRYKDVRGPELDAAVAELVAEAEAGK